MDLVHFLHPLFIFLGTLFLNLLSLLLLGLFHCLKTVIKCLHEAVHGFGHFLLEIVDLTVNLLHLRLRPLDLIPGLIQIMLVFLRSFTVLF